MRERFHGQLAGLGERLAGMCAVAAEELELANRALFEADPELARLAIRRDRELDHEREKCELAAARLLALQAPVAGDLRLVLAAVHSADRIERMGDLARHIAELVVRADGEPVLPEPLRPEFERMAECALAMARDLGGFLAESGSPAGDRLQRADMEVDRAHERVLTLLTEGSWAHGIPHAVTVTLLARFYERFADQAVRVARRADFATTGSFRG